MKYQNLPGFYETQISFASKNTFFQKRLITSLENLALPLWEQIGILFEGAREGVETMKVNITKLGEDKAKAQTQTEKNCL